MAMRFRITRPRPLELGRRLVDLLGPTGDAARQSLVALGFNSCTSFAAGAVLDSIAAKYGQENLGLGRAGLKTNRAWTMRRDMVSPRATTHWDELITVAAK